MRLGRVVAALAGALVLQILLTGFTALLPGEGSTYGAPLPVGESCALCGVTSFGFGGGESTFSWPLFALNVAATAAVFLLLLRLGGHALLVPLGSALFLVLAAVMYFRLDAGLPFAGLPLPIATPRPLVDYPQVALLALWIDCMSGAAIFGALGVLRGREGRWGRPAVVSVVAAFLVVGIVMVVTSLGPDVYGGPIPVGRSEHCSSLFALRNCEHTFSLPIFLLDIGITAALLFGASTFARRSLAPPLTALGVQIGLVLIGLVNSRFFSVFVLEPPWLSLWAYSAGGAVLAALVARARARQAERRSAGLPQV